MPNYSLITLLSCHGLEDFPTHHKGELAHGLLASLTGLWHPTVIATAESIPRWCRIDQVPENCEKSILVAPSIASSQLPTGLAERVAFENGLLLVGESCRSAIVAKTLEYMGLPPVAEKDELANDFWSLGYAYWQIQLMTRQLRYSSHLDEVQFQRLVVTAASAFAEKKSDDCRRGLQSAFDLLIQERNRYFPVDALMIELVLVAPTTLGDSLNQAVKSDTPINLLLSGDLAENLARNRPDIVESIRAQAAESNLEIVGGSASEPRYSLMSLESMVGQLRRGREIFRRVFEVQPTYFGRRRVGMTSVLPQVLLEWGYRGAIHALFDVGHFPPVAAGSIEWQSPDGSTIAALSATPIDAAQPDAFARLGITIGESFDASHSAMLLFAHWPTNRSIWFDDLLRTMKYGNVLGRFVTLSEFFQKASFSGRRERYSEDQYRSDYLNELQQAQHANPLSRCVDYWRNRSQLSQSCAIQLMSCLLGHPSAPSSSLATDERLLRLDERIDCLVDSTNDDGATAKNPNSEGSESAAGIEAEVSDLFREQAQKLREQLASPDHQAAPERNASDRLLVVANPLSFARRIVCPVSAAFQSTPVEKPVYALEVDDRGGFVAIDVPPFGFATVAASGQKQAKRRALPSIIEGHRLRNEFFEVEVDAQTGGVRSIHCHDRRGNLFSQMLGICLPPGLRTKGGLESTYARPVSSSVEVTLNHSLVGEIAVRGQLLIDDQPAADFEQRIRVSRGRRVIELEVELSPRGELTDDPWRHYYCSRFAWPNEGADLYRAVNETRWAIVESRFEAPQWIEIVDGPSRISILTNGLPFHRRYDYRKLDTLLGVRGESRLRFRLGIGVDISAPTYAAREFGTEPLAWETSATRRMIQSTAWLLRTDCRNVLITAVELIQTDEVPVGVRLRLKETEGRAGNGKIESARTFASARRVRFDGESKSELNLVDGAVQFGFAANEYWQIELLW